ncbi:MAG TPA: heavy metal response regulator transcription factor [Gammaproteobacteria bacterium]|nr:heavy metal response regulator transcription factor [Gammaproteobacteria bacterium]
MRILVVDDEDKTAAYLSSGLTENGFQVDIAHNGQDGLALANKHNYDLIILDVMLPKLDGWAVIKQIRRSHPDVRVLFLTACDDVEEKVKGLELGADDYLIKPFAFSELLARIRTLLRRSSTKQSTHLLIADLNINLIEHRATRGTQKLDLTPQEFSLLTFLAQHPGEVLSRTLIASKVWNINFDTDTNIVDVAIRRLRQKVDDPFPVKLIHSIRGIGYILEQR